MALRHLISPLDLTEEETTRILDLADRIGTHKEAYAHLAEGKQLATLLVVRHWDLPVRNSPVLPKEKPLPIPSG